MLAPSLFGGPDVKTHDYEYAFRGYHDREAAGRCRVRIIEREGSAPLLILTELASNPSTSVTNMVEHLVPELIAKHMPHRFEVVDEPPAIVVEHYEPIPGKRRGLRQKPTYDLVTFGNWRPRRVWLSGQERLSLGEPDWRHMPEHEIRDLLGDEAEDLAASKDSATC